MVGALEAIMPVIMRQVSVAQPSSGKLGCELAHTTSFGCDVSGQDLTDQFRASTSLFKVVLRKDFASTCSILQIAIECITTIGMIYN